MSGKSKLGWATNSAGHDPHARPALTAAARPRPVLSTVGPHGDRDRASAAVSWRLPVGAPTGQRNGNGPPPSMAASKRQRVYSPESPRGPVPSQSTLRPASTFAGTARTLKGKGPTGTSPSIYTPGQVIRTLFMTPNLDPRAEVNDLSIAVTQDLGSVSAKLRPFVILAVTETHLKCIPMYTSGGRGFDNKPAREKWECIYLRHWTDESKVWQDVQPFKYLMTDPKYVVKEGSYLMWTRSYDVLYDWPIAKMGGLSDESFARLQEMHKIGYSMGANPLKDQFDLARGSLREIKVNDEFKEMKEAQLVERRPSTIVRPGANWGKELFPGK